MEKKLPDMSHGMKIGWGSFAPDLSGGMVKKSEKSQNFTGSSGSGGDEQAFPTKGGGLAKTTFPGADDHSLIKEFN